jgi:heme exporter protein CcmD
MIEYLTTDRYAVYVVAAWGSSALILGWLIVQSVLANARARREMDEAERELRDR